MSGTDSNTEMVSSDDKSSYSFFDVAQLCHEPFWTFTRAWNSSSPDFGICFERTVLVWIPCLFLWLCSPFYVFILKRRPVYPLPWTALSYTKVMVSVLLLMVSTAELVWAVANGPNVVPIADFIAPAFLLITQKLHLTLVILGGRRSERSSGIIWFFWFAMLLCGLPQLYTTVTSTVHGDLRVPAILVVTFFIQYLCCVVLFITNCLSDAPSKLQTLYKTEKPSPELDASFPSRIFFLWSAPLVWLGWRRPLTPEDLWDVAPDLTAAAVYDAWQATLTREERAKCKMKNDTIKSKNLTITTVRKATRISLVRRLWLLTRWSVLFACLLCFLSECCRFLSPHLLSLLIRFMTDNTEPVWHGYLYAVSLFLTCELTTLIRNYYFNCVIILSVKVRSTLMSAVYDKALHLSGAARRDSTVGQIVNLMAVDAQSVGDTMFHLCNLMFAPVVIIVALTFLWVRLGPSVLAGLAVLLMIVPINSAILKKTKEVQFKTMTFKDKRVKMINEIIGGIKVLKFYAWEAAFSAKIDAVRKEEMKLYKTCGVLQAFSSFIFHVAPYMVALATFTTFLLVSAENVLDAETAFVSIALFNIMRMPMIQMPNVISQLIQASVAVKRMEKYISSSELDPMAVNSEPSEHGAVVVRGGQFSWEGEEGQTSWQLQDIDFKILKGQLVALVGTVGSGKSSLLAALLGEMRKDAGKVIVNGNLAYVPQQAWLQNATLRDNIIWGQPFEHHRYWKVVRACALQADLDMLPAGDLTEIGEKGINISGGQKQRVALARAAYSRAGIVLLDDPLSAVDAHVGKHIFENVIGPCGILQGKTRILVTHAVTFLPQVDEIIVLKNGRLGEKGSYNNLLASGGDFAQYIVQHIHDMEEEDAEKELEELCDHLEDVAGGDVLLRQLSFRRSSHTSSIRERHVSGRHRSVSETDAGYGKRCSWRPVVESHNDSWPLLYQGHLNNVASRSHTTNSRPSSTSAHHDGSDPKDYDSSSMNLRMTNYGSGSKNPTNTEAKLSAGGKSSVREGQKLIDEEISQTGKVARLVYLVYGRAMGMIFVIIPIVFVSLGQASNAGSNVWLSHWSSSAHLNATNETVVDKDVFLAVYGAFGISQAFFLFVGMLCLMLGGVRASRDLHDGLLHTIIRLPMSFFDTNPSGRIMNRFSKDINALDTVLPGIIRAFINNIFQVFTTMVVIVAATPITAVFIVPIMGLYYFIQQVFVATSRQLMRIESVSKSPIYSHFNETIQGVSTIRAYKKQSNFFNESLRRIECSLKAAYINIGVNRWLGVLLETMGNVITFAASVLGVAGRETISPGIVGLSVTYALNITNILNWVVRIVSDLEANIVSVERINEYMKIKKEAAWKVEDGAPPALWPEAGHVSFNNYKTRYRPGLDLVLKGITCSIKPAEKVGIVGRTGAGKSSLMQALFRLIEAAGGHIAIDDINIAKIGLHDLRSQISIIPQDPVLFSGTLRLNLDPFGVCEDADIWRALELAHLSDYVRQQAQGLEHTVDEDGSNLSVGQRQLVCLARALLRNSQVLVLDEATAAVDLHTDHLIQTTIRNQFTDCTVLTIAHRLNTIMDCDRVMVLKEGSIAEFDSPSALLERPDSIFYGMAKDARLV
ncbi:multidrug resistance-associated protein 1-like [Panulirus ornatus]|uniref:multidrug resistance-associated protein 1-like n=1 Tax=Panulirus ornatus TaxID=150431 RepID=UPI003A87F09D